MDEKKYFLVETRDGNREIISELMDLNEALELRAEILNTEKIDIKICCEWM